MFKRLFLALAFAGLLSTAHSAGTIPGFSLAQQQDEFGTPLIGCRLFTFEAGTPATVQTAYQDSALTIPLSHPILCDAFGRLPQIFLADGSIKLRLEKSTGVVVFSADGILVVGASSGGGGGSPVDATTVIATGDVKYSYRTGNLTGFVRGNGRTIGSATSGATERANSDTEPLYVHLWETDPNLTVSTGRGANAAADFAANKTIALPDFRGRVLAGLADMGNSDNALFSGVTFTSGNATTLGAQLGAARRTLAITNIPAHDHNVFLNDPGHDHTYTDASGGQSGSDGTPHVGGVFTGAQNTSTETTGITVRSASGGGGTANKTASTGSTTAFDAVSPFALITVFIKL